MAMRKFETGQQVVVERGQNKGLEGTVIGMNPIDGIVEVDVDGTSFFLANGTVQFKEKAKTTFNAETGEAELVAKITPKSRQFQAKKPKSMIEMVEEKAAGTEEPPVQEPVKSTNVKKESGPCSCGCGEMASKGRMFRPGHDQRHKGNLIKAMQNGDAEAEAELRKRAWRTDAQIMELKKVGGTVDLEAELSK